MFDEDNVKLAKKKGGLPPCSERSVNYPMHQFLLSATGDTLSISLVELGRTRGDWGEYPRQLPDSAYDYLPWWGGYNDKKPYDRTHTLAWLNAGWYVDQLLGVEKNDIPKADKRVIFKRIK